MAVSILGRRKKNVRKIPKPQKKSTTVSRTFKVRDEESNGGDHSEEMVNSTAVLSRPLRRLRKGRRTGMNEPAEEENALMVCLPSQAFSTESSDCETDPDIF
jgi:hypothetical protein